MAAAGAAAHGNNAPANFLIVVTDPKTGEGVANLVQANVTIIDHFSLPAQACGFSNNITLFHGVGTGAYQVQVVPHAASPPPSGCRWVAGEYLAQIMVHSATKAGQSATTLTIR